MANTSLAERLEYAILSIVCQNPSDARHQDSWGNWRLSVQSTVPEFVDADLVSAFRRLGSRGMLRLSKPDSHRYHAIEYSGNEGDDNSFFFMDRFNASITDEGRSYWNATPEPKVALFISHVGEEKAVALKLQAIIQTAFSNSFPVFVSSDPGSLGGGEEWYHHILDNLAKARVILVRLSPESSDRPWINFEAGFGQGRNSRVIPLAFRGLSFDSLEYPLKGLQGYYLPALKEILSEISKRMSVPMLTNVDLAAACQEINDLQIELPARKLALELERKLSHPKQTCNFYLVNNGNRDIEPLEVTIWFPSAILYCPFRPAIDAAILEVREASLDGIAYTEVTYRNNREPPIPERFSKPERLISRLAPGMRSRLQLVSIEACFPLKDEELRVPIRYKILAKQAKPVAGTILLKDKLSAPTT